MSMIQPVQGRMTRCAIYTRKSAEPPLGQEITSLQSQRAICSAYVSSQQHRGWLELRKCYDDAGRTGSNLGRPALQELLTDIELGLVDVVLVYKLDRITRTLLDFVRLIDFFDRHGVVFVAITQNFDTSDSMGRLIRNVLLTFAQFEREIACDRMRDKKMVMKQNGLWTGGDAPIGYDLRRGKLITNKVEAPALRCIFETYIETRSMAAVHKRLIERGFRRKVWRTKTGGTRGGGHISLTALHHILQNPVYIGELSHKGKRYPGIHEPIIDRSLWQRAQEVLKEREQFKPRRPSNLLTGLLFDAYGRPMHARWGRNTFGTYRYYSSAVVTWAVRQKLRPMRARADQLEQLVLTSLKSLLADRRQLRPLLMRVAILGSDLDRLSGLGSSGAVRLDNISLDQLSLALKALIYRVEVSDDCVRALVRLEAIARFLVWDGTGLFRLDDLEVTRATQIHVIDIAAAVYRERKKSLLPIEPCRSKKPTPSPKLVSLLEDARAAQKLLFDNRDVSVSDLAHSLGSKPATFSRLVRLNYLAPDIVAAILDGAQPPTLNRKVLIGCDLPVDWALQRRLLGFPARPERQVQPLMRSEVSAALAR